MMGLALMDDALPVLKQNNAILAFTEKDAQMTAATTCIRCGRCVDACPMHLMPTAIARAYAAGDVEDMARRGVMTCMECGCCSYSCPAHRPIVQTMRHGQGAGAAAQGLSRPGRAALLPKDYGRMCSDG